MDDETKQAIVDAEQRAKDFATSLKASYIKQDTAWQKYRREHPIAMQNALGFGGLLIGLGLGFSAGKFF